MDVAQLLQDLFSRVDELVPSVVDGLADDQLAAHPAGAANPIGWLVWHLTRVEDDHLAGVTGGSQLWDEGWRERFGLDLEPHATGYGAGESDVAAVRASAELLTGYHAAVAARVQTVLDTLDADALERVVDENWDPPVTLGVRLVSMASDCLQHLGQAAYARGIMAAA